jgi:hypothetical protein
MRNLRTLITTEINQYQRPEVSHSAVTTRLCNMKRAPFEMTTLLRSDVLDTNNQQYSNIHYIQSLTIYYLTRKNAFQKKILQAIHCSQDIFLSNNFILDICVVCKQEYKRYDGKTKNFKSSIPGNYGIE